MKPSITQSDRLGNTLRHYRIDWLSHDNSSAGVKDMITGKVEYMPLMRMSRMGTWEPRTERVAVANVPVNGHHGVYGFGIVDKILDASHVYFLEAQTEVRRAA